MRRSSRSGARAGAAVAGCIEPIGWASAHRSNGRVDSRVALVG